MSVTWIPVRTLLDDGDITMTSHPAFPIPQMDQVLNGTSAALSWAPQQSNLYTFITSIVVLVTDFTMPPLASPVPVSLSSQQGFNRTTRILDGAMMTGGSKVSFKPFRPYVLLPGESLDVSSDEWATNNIDIRQVYVEYYQQVSGSPRGGRQPVDEATLTGGR